MKQKAFTLIELLVVVAIIGILASSSVLSDSKNPYDTTSYAIVQPTTAFVLGQVSLSATVVSPYKINLHTCIEATCDTDAKKIIDSVAIE